MIIAVDALGFTCQERSDDWSTTTACCWSKFWQCKQLHKMYV